MHPTGAAGSGRVSRRTLLKATTATAGSRAAGFVKGVDISRVSIMPFTGYAMGAWYSATQRPTVFMNGFTPA